MAYYAWWDTFLDAPTNSFSCITLCLRDFGHLYCWAVNDKGAMQDPCIFHVIPAGPPQPPSTCTILNQTTDLLQVILGIKLPDFFSLLFHFKIDENSEFP